MPHQRINHHVSRPGIEREYIFKRRARGNHGDVRNPADIQRGATDPRVPIKQEIDKRYERRALSSRGHIRRTKISDRRNSGAPGDHRRIANLQRRGDAPPRKCSRPSLMKNGLPVGTDHGDLRRSHSKFSACGERRLREYFAEQKIKLADFSRRDRTPFGELQDRFLRRRLEGKRRKVFQSRAPPFESDERHVNSVRRRSGHDAESQRAASAGAFHKICFFNSASRFSASMGLRLSTSASRKASSTLRSSGVNKTSCAGGA